MVLSFVIVINRVLVIRLPALSRYYSSISIETGEYRHLQSVALSIEITKLVSLTTKGLLITAVGKYCKVLVRSKSFIVRLFEL